MSAQRVLAITRRLMRQFRRDRRTLALLFVAPVIILGLFYFLLRGGGSPPAVGVVDLDQGPLGAAVTRQLLTSTVVRASQMDETTAAAGLKSGRLAGYVVLPADFSSAALRTAALRPEIHLEGSEPSQSGPVVQAAGQAVVGAASAVLATTGGPVPRLDPAVSYLFGGPSLDTLDYLGGAFIGLVVFFLVFVVTCVSFLRERSQGTLERLMASPLRRGEIVLGYMLAFTVLALAQAAEVLLFGLLVLRLHNAGNVGLVFGIEILLALSAVNMGIFLSMFARTEFQAVQFIPLVVVPQVLLSGIVFPVVSEPGWLQTVSNALPMTYAVNGLRDVMLKGGDLGWQSIQVDAAVVLAFALAALVAAATTLRRRAA